MRSSGIYGVLTACILLAACGAKDQVEKAFEAKYAKDLCLQLADSFPITVTYQTDLSEAPEAGWIQALVKEGVLVPGAVTQSAEASAPQSGEASAPLNMAAFDLSEEGRAYLRDNRLCYGKTEVDRVLTTREYATGAKRFLDAQVLLRHVVTAPWANNPDLKQYVKSGRETVQRTLSRTDDGWMLP
ncbi:hypothetical protein [Pedomonas sp. V897]|uniref:hypothetical protein n=1 Tax=Pedomonas sp. V897 TaxID=3446482 RepID=UPI003EE11C8C